MMETGRLAARGAPPDERPGEGEEEVGVKVKVREGQITSARHHNSMESWFHGNVSSSCVLDASAILAPAAVGHAPLLQYDDLVGGGQHLWVMRDH